MFFSTTRKTLPKNLEKCPAKAAIAKPKNMYFWRLKYDIFIPTSHSIIHKYV
jgi:hypothetical protein